MYPHRFYPRRPASTLLTLVGVLMLVWLAPGHARAQQGVPYRATNGCVYQQSGAQMVPIQCQWFDQSVGTQVLRNTSGTFFLFEGTWATADGYNLLVGLRNLAGAMPPSAASPGTVAVAPNGVLYITPAAPDIGGNVGGPVPLGGAVVTSDPCNGDLSVLPPSIAQFCRDRLALGYRDGIRWTQDEYGHRHQAPPEGLGARAGHDCAASGLQREVGEANCSLIAYCSSESPLARPEKDAAVTFRWAVQYDTQWIVHLRSPCKAVD